VLPHTKKRSWDKAKDAFKQYPDWYFTKQFGTKSLVPHIKIMPQVENSTPELM
jgi:hypothetical protein